MDVVVSAAIAGLIVVVISSVLHHIKVKNLNEQFDSELAKAKTESWKEGWDAGFERGGSESNHIDWLNNREK